MKYLISRTQRKAHGDAYRQMLEKIASAEIVPNGYAAALLCNKDPSDGTRILHFDAYEMFRKLTSEPAADARRFFPDIFRESRMLIPASRR